MIGFFKRLWPWTPKPEPVIGYSVTFSGPLATWQESLLEVSSLTFDPVVGDDECDDEDEPVLMHNPDELGFPQATARFRHPDHRRNDLLIFSESSQSYVTIKRFEHPQATAEVVMRMREGWTFDEATRAN